MQFLVELRRMDAPQMPPQAEVALAKQTFQRMLQNAEPRIKAAYPYAGERAGALVVEAASGDELSEILGGLPFFPAVSMSIHPLATLEQSLRATEQAEAMLAQMAQGAPPR